MSSSWLASGFDCSLDHAPPITAHASSVNAVYHALSAGKKRMSSSRRSFLKGESLAGIVDMPCRYVSGGVFGWSGGSHAQNSRPFHWRATSAAQLIQAVASSAAESVRLNGRILKRGAAGVSGVVCFISIANWRLIRSIDPDFASGAP